MATSPDRSLWDQRLSRYRALNAIFQASKAFGPFYDAKEALAWAEIDAKEKYGTLARAQHANDPALQEAYAANDEENNRLLEKHDNPAFEAAVLLVQTPAPDLSAVEYKLGVIQAHELHLYPHLPNPFELVEADALAFLREAA